MSTCAADNQLRRDVLVTKKQATPTDHRTPAPIGASGGFFCTDGVGDAADSFHGHGDGVTVFEEQLGVTAVSDSGWCADEDDVPWFQGGEFGDRGDECGDAEDQVGEVRFLDGFPVQGGADARLADVGFCRGDDVRAERDDVVPDLALQPLVGLVLENAHGDVVGDAVAKDVVHSVLFGDSAACLADEDGEFALEGHLGGFQGKDDVVGGSYEGECVLGEEDGKGDRAGVVGMVLVQAHAEDLAGPW